MKNILIALVLTVALFSSPNISYSQTNQNEASEQKKEEVQKVNEPKSIQEDTSNELGLIYSSKKLEEASGLIQKGDFLEAEKLLLGIKEWLTDATEYHYQLFQILSKRAKTVNPSKVEKAHALDFGQLRDQCYFLLAKIYIGENKLKEAVKLLTEIIKSQSDSNLGLEAYKTLQEIKFSDKAN